jgi:hypothetical protein
VKLCFVFLLAALSAQAIEVVNEGNGKCEEFSLNYDLPVYKDPTIFLSALKDRARERDMGLDSMATESPLLTTVTGKVSFMRLGPEQPFKNFGDIARLYELSDPRIRLRTKPGSTERAPLIVPVMFCGATAGAYSDTLGFILLNDLREAQKLRSAKGSLPPSGYPNPIPEYKGRGG